VRPRAARLERMLGPVLEGGCCTRGLPGGETCSHNTDGATCATVAVCQTTGRKQIVGVEALQCPSRNVERLVVADVLPERRLFIRNTELGELNCTEMRIRSALKVCSGAENR
jgi:hypothetical protein